jgi:hypothetical protein
MQKLSRTLLPGDGRGSKSITLTPEMAKHNSRDGDLDMTHAIRRHVFDGHIGNVEWDLKSLAHRWTRFSGYCNVNLLT